MTDILSRAGAIKDVATSLDHVPDSDAVVTTLIRSCEELTSSGSAPAALKLIELADSIRGTIPDSWRIRFEIAKASALRVVGHYERSLRLCRALLIEEAEHLAQLPDQYIQLRITEGGCLWQLNASDEAIERLTQLRQELLSGPDSKALAQCTFELSSAHLFHGSIESARALAMDGLVSARRSGARALEGFSLENLGRIDKYLCRWSSAEECSRLAMAIYEDLGYAIALVINHSALSIILWKRGRLSEALKWAEASLAGSFVHDSKPHQRYTSLLLANIHIHAGRHEDAQALLGSNGIPLPQDRAGILREELLGDLYLELGAFDKALAQFEVVYPAAVSMAPRGDIASELPRRRAEALLGLGKPLDAYNNALLGLENCRRRRDRYEEAAIYRTLGLSAAALGKYDEAKQWFQQGFAYYDDIETPYEWGKLWMAYGDWLRGPNAGEHSDKEGALEAYRAAKEHFEHMGAMGKLAEVQARLAEYFPQAPVASPENAATSSTADLIRPRRRPRGSGELDRRSAWARDNFGYITRNKVVLDLLRDVAKLARSQSPVLILGESGTGKELVASGIHRLSNRTGNYMPINCGALPRDVIESELFGHTSGAFTGATRDKMGLFESCNDGTVFLDEVAEMSLDLQSKLLRFLETGEFRRVGSTKNVGVDVLIIAATNRERDALASGEGFRADLYYRLAHAVITLPPLRRRGEDIDLLISHFLDEALARHKKQVVLSTAARNQMIAYSWPGNVRQLRSTVNRLVVLSEPGAEVGPELLELPAAEAPANLMEELGQAERRKIVEALAQAAGVRTEAAKTLGMSRTTLIGKMKRFGIQ